jgi:tetratricopeptide (TPR) repeat protein
MRSLPAVSLVAALVATPLWAQTNLDKAIEKASTQVEKGKLDDAVKTLTKAAEEAGAPGYLALGRFQEGLGNLDEAGAAYDRARSTAGPAERAEAFAVSASFALRVGPGKEALALASRAVEAEATPTTLAVKARALVRTEDARGALETADQALAVDSRSALAHIARGEALFALGQNVEAEQALRHAVELAPRSALAYSRLARIQVALGKPQDAVAAGRKATELDESFGEGFAILGGALLAENLNNWGQAIAQAQQGAFLDPASPIAHIAVGRIFQANRQLDQAVLAYQRALMTDPDFTPARLALIEAELAQGHREAAMEEAKKGAGDRPASPQVLMLLGEMAERDGNHVVALGYLEKALEDLPGIADGWALLGRAYQALGRPNDAADAYGRAVELAPRNFGYRTTYGLVLGMSGDLDGGLAELRRVVETPCYAEEDAWVNLGWVHRNRNEPTESVAAYRKALEIDPGQAQAALGLSSALR